jgi:trypsin
MVRLTPPPRAGAAQVFVLALLAVLVVAAPAGAVYGGRSASAGEQPWAAAIELSGESGVVCSGDVIAPTKVLTAAHCAAGTPAADLVVATSAADVRDPRAQRSGVTDVAIDPDYSRVDSSYDDFAVLTLARPTTAPAVRLAGPDDHRVSLPGARLTIAGWGVTTFHGNDFPNRLRVAGINALAYGRCYDQFAPDFSSDLMICGAGARSGRGTAQACQGDSGGPVTALDATGRAVLVAITSFGNQCGDPLNVYSKIDAVAGWIAAAARIGAPADALSPPRPQISATHIAGGRLRVSAANLPAGAAMRVYAISRIGGDKFPVRTLTSRISAAVIGAGSGVRAVGVVFVQRYAYGPLAYLRTNPIR